MIDRNLALVQGTVSIPTDGQPYTLLELIQVGDPAFRWPAAGTVVEWQVQGDAGGTAGAIILRATWVETARPSTTEGFALLDGDVRRIYTRANQNALKFFNVDSLDNKVFYTVMTDSSIQ